MPLKCSGEMIKTCGYGKNWRWYLRKELVLTPYRFRGNKPDPNMYYDDSNYEGLQSHRWHCGDMCNESEIALCSDCERANGLEW